MLITKSPPGEPLRAGAPLPRFAPRAGRLDNASAPMAENDERTGPAKDGAKGDDDAREAEGGRSAPFGWVSLVIIVALVVGTWFLIQRLSDDAKMQDCVQSGRRNCAPIDDTRP